MYKVTSNIEKNRLYITLGGFLTINESVGCKEQIVKEVNNLKEGFDVINDFSNLHSSQDTSGKYLVEIVGFLEDQKVNRIVRVVGSSETALIKFAQLTGRFNALKFKYVPTLRDAEDYLEKQNNL